MRMKPEHAARLQQLLTLTNLSPRSRLILARRVVRHICTERSLNPGHDAYPLHRKTLFDIGTWLCQNEAALTAQYGFEGLCEVLEVNPVHRTQVIEGVGLSSYRRGTRLS